KGRGRRPFAEPYRWPDRVRVFAGILRALLRVFLFAAAFRRAQPAWRFPGGPPVLPSQPWEGIPTLEPKKTTPPGHSAWCGVVQLMILGSPSNAGQCSTPNRDYEGHFWARSSHLEITQVSRR